MNFITATALNFQGTFVKEAWLDGNKIWGSPIFWTFPTPPSGRSITGFSITTDPAGTILVNWGDSSSDTINSGSLVNKTY
jgi:hypothetical protein